MTAPRPHTELPPARGRPAYHGPRGPHDGHHGQRPTGAPAGVPGTVAEQRFDQCNDAVHHPLVAFDITGFGDPRRDDQVQRHVRQTMYRTLTEAFTTCEIEWRYWQDRGDGVLIVGPPGLPMARLVDPLVDKVREALRDHNEVASEPAQIQLRMALHGGSVLFDDYGVIGHALTRLFAMLDAPAFKREFTDPSRELGLITSDYVYDDVIRHCSGRIDPAGYDPIDVMEHDRSTRAWVHMPGGLGGPTPSRGWIRATTVPGQGLRDKVRDITRVAQ
jgi:hypothetical protein